jgi:hypothetical protein
LLLIAINNNVNVEIIFFIIYIVTVLNNRVILIQNISIDDIFDEYLENILVLLNDFSFKYIDIITMIDKVVNIHNHNIIINGIINNSLPILSNKKYIAHAKLQGASHDRKAIHNVFSFFSLIDLFL